MQSALRSVTERVMYMSVLKRRVGSGLAVAALVVAGVAVSAVPANAASGTVTCATSNVVGVWVNVSGGTSGWASRTATSDPHINYYSYNTQGKSWSVNVGCGGTPSNWAQSISSNWSTLQGAATISCADVGYARTCRIG